MNKKLRLPSLRRLSVNVLLNNITFIWNLQLTDTFWSFKPVSMTTWYPFTFVASTCVLAYGMWRTHARSLTLVYVCKTIQRRLICKLQALSIPLVIAVMQAHEKLVHETCAGAVVHVIKIVWVHWSSVWNFLVPEQKLAPNRAAFYSVQVCGLCGTNFLSVCHPYYCQSAPTISAISINGN